MYTKNDLLACLAKAHIDPKGTVLIHSSMKAVGEVEGGADTVSDAFCEYMKVARPRRSKEMPTVSDRVYAFGKQNYLRLSLRFCVGIPPANLRQSALHCRLIRSKLHIPPFTNTHG